MPFFDESAVASASMHRHIQRRQLGGEAPTASCRCELVLISLQEFYWLKHHSFVIQIGCKHQCGRRTLFSATPVELMTNCTHMRRALLGGQAF